MELENLNVPIDRLTGKPLDNCIVIFSDGKVQKLQLPEFARVEIKTANGKVNLIENTQQFKL